MYKRLVLVNFLAFVIASIFQTTMYAESKNEPTLIYRYHTDRLKQELVAKLPPFHFAAMSPGTSFIYLERIGATKNDATTSFLYNLKTKKLLPLNGGKGKWYPKSDKLLLQEAGNLISFDPVTYQSRMLVAASKNDPIIDYAVSPDETYMVFFKKDLSVSKQETLLYLQHLPTGKMKVNDRFSSTDEKNRFSRYFQWFPNSKKVFYIAGTSIKELDLPTGLKFVHKRTDLPSYSADLQYAYESNQTGDYLKKLDNGKTTLVGKYTDSIYQGSLDNVKWSPTGHSFVADEFLYGSNAQDTYSRLHYQNGEKGRYFPDVSYGEPKLFLHENVRFIGWSKDSKWIYTADLHSIHCNSYEGRCVPYSNSLLVSEP
ncbi:hypothetical protein [Brevibacillus sp. NRS-1366]|uniref:hypothetical protein n=1 Tax=Brevibacillus sp. NRS-1366 TaxID=3233899 RepID=UPI003D1D96E8